MSRAQDVGVRTLLAAALVPCAFVAALLCAEGEARAQSIEMTNVRRTISGRTDAFRFYISRRDCQENNTDFEFPMTLSNLGGVSSLEIWISEGDGNCALDQERRPPQPRCRLLRRIGAPQQFMREVISSRAIAQEIVLGTVAPPEGTGGGTPGGEGGAAGEGGEGGGFVEPDPSGFDCVDPQGITTPRPVNLFFMLFRGAGSDIPQDDYVIYSEAKVDLVGPPPPTNVQSSVGDRSAELSYSVGTNPEDRLGFRFFCEQIAGPGEAELGAACSPSLLVPGQLPPGGVDSCGSSQVASGTARPLVNGAFYAIGISAYDQIDNEGPLSDVTCVLPIEVDDFFEAYRAAGGQAGGGYCAASAGPSPKLGGALAGGLLALGIASVWRRRRNESRRRKESRSA